MLGREKSEEVAPRVDALLCPAMPFPAPPCDIPRGSMLSIAYVAMFNFMAMPAGTVPVTLVTQE